ncbi:MAG: CarD family transcriptional regulator, partial [Armatimonadota bacterium]
MSLESLVQLSIEWPRLREALDQIVDGTRLLQIEGLAAAAKGLVLAGVFRRTRRTMLVVTYTREQAERIAEDLPHYGISRDSVAFLPSSDSLIYEEGPPDFSLIGERLAALYALASGKTVVVVAPIDAALRLTMPRDTLIRSHASVRVGDQMDIGRFAVLLASIGYEHTDIVDRHGEFSKRGGLVDVYASNEDDPLRIELFGDEIESIRHFDSATQRSTDKIPSAVILPAREVVLDPDNARSAVRRIRSELELQVKSLQGQGEHEAAGRLLEKVEDDILRIESLAYFDEIEYYLPYIHPEECSVFDYLPADAIVVLDEPMQIRSHWEHHEEQLVETLINRAGRGAVLATRQRHHVPFESTIKRVLETHQAIALTLLPRPIPWAKTEATVSIYSSPTESFGGRVEAAIDQIKTWSENGLDVVIATAQDARMLEILQEHGIAGGRLEDEYPESLARAPARAEQAPSALEEPSEQASGRSKGRCGRVWVAHSPLRSGYRLTDAGLVVLTDSDIFGTQRLVRPRKPSHEGIPISSVLDLKEGDFVVHVNHGIGKYLGIQSLVVEGVRKDYLFIKYAGEDRLYVPT